jgi:hypothetical protein
MDVIEWEGIGDEIDRIEVPGGWLVRTGYDGNFGICFYPDPEHKWN